MSFSATDAQTFFNKYYVPANMVVAVVGDVKAPRRCRSSRSTSAACQAAHARHAAHGRAEAERRAPRRAARAVAADLHRGLPPPGHRTGRCGLRRHRDLLSEGRTSRLYRSLVRDKKIAAVSAGFSGFPGTSTRTCSLSRRSAPGHKPEEIGDAIHAEIERLKNEDVSADELKMIKTRAKANLIRGLDSNEGLAHSSPSSQTLYGDWRELFRTVDRIDKVSEPIFAADC